MRAVGWCCSAVASFRRFELVQTGVRLSNDPVFRTGSVYNRTSAPQKTGPTALLVRFIETLTDAEAQQALQLLKKRR